jgi:hypothetical protein
MRNTLEDQGAALALLAGAVRRRPNAFEEAF